MTIEIIVSSTGDVRVESRGYHGRDCLEATKQLEAALGAKQCDQLTAEFYRPVTHTQQELRGGC